MANNWDEKDLAKALKAGGAREHGGVVNKKQKKVIRPMSISFGDGSGITFTEATVPDPLIGSGIFEPVYKVCRPVSQQFFVPGLLPGQNTFMGNGTHWKYGSAKRLWMGFIRRAIHHAKLTPMQRVQIAWEWRERNRMRDPDNFTGINKKFILDTLVEVGILPDDGWDEIAGWTDRWHVDASNPGVLVTLTEAP